VGIIAKPLGLLLTGIYNVVNNYGIALIIFTVVVRVCMIPLYTKQIKTSAEMSSMQPKIQEIQQRYAKNPELMQQKISEVYAEYNYNPMSGCLPMLIQMPIIMGLFALLRNPMLYMNSESMIMAVHESFLWVSDLSQPDTWILPIAAGLTQYFSFTTQTATMDQSSAGMMNSMKYFFPVMIFLMGRSFPAGLSLYWFVGTLVTIAQNFMLRGYKDKVKEQAAENRSKKKNGGKDKKKK